MKKVMLAAIAALLLLAGNTYASGFGSGFVSGHPEYDFAWYTVDGSSDFHEPPYAKFVSGTLTLGQGSEMFPLPGVRSPYVVYNSSTIPCDGTNGGAEKKSDSGNDMMWCDGANWIDITTTLKNVVSDTAILSSTVGGLFTSVNTISNTLPNYTLLTTYNGGIVSLTTAVNGKASQTAFNALQAKVSSTETSLTSAVNGKFATPAGTTAQYLRGDGSTQTFPSIPAAMSFGFASATRTLNTAFQVSATTGMLSTYVVDVSVNSALLAGQQGTVTLEYADNSGISTNVVTVASGTNATSGVLNLTNIGSITLSGMIPQGKWVRLRTTNTAGSPSFTYRSGFETVF